MNDLDALMAQGLAAVEAGELDTARQIYEHCLELDPTETAVQVRLAMVLMHQEKYEAALEITRQIIKRGKGKRIGYEIAGMCYRDLGQLAEAEQVFRQAIAIKPDPSTLIFLHVVLARTGQREAGMKCLQEALKLDPNNDEAHYNLGCSYKLRDEYELAEQHLRRAIEIDPNYAIAYAELGCTLSYRAYLAMGRSGHENVYVKEANRVLLRATELDPAYGWSRIYLAQLLWHTGKHNAAEEQYQAALAIWPEDSLTHCCYGRFLSATHRDHAKADQLLRKAIKLEPDDAIAHYYLGKHLLRCKHKFKAKQALEKAVELGYQKAAKLLAEIEGSQ